MLESPESCHAHQFPVAVSRTNGIYLQPHVADSQSSNDSIRQQTVVSHSLDSVGSYVCRICHQQSALDEVLVAPCRCKGTLAYVHMSCLEHWLNQSCRNRCELCRYRFNAVETLRYRCSESLRIWMSHPRNRRYVQSDMLVLALLTVVTMGLVAVCLLGMRYFIIEGKKIGVSQVWTQGAIIFFLTIVVVGYFTTAYLLVKEQLTPWYRWWRRTVNVRLVIEPTQNNTIHHSNSIEECENDETIMTIDDIDTIGNKMETIDSTE